MIIFPDLSKVFCLGSYCFRYSYLLLLIIPIIIILIWLLRQDFVKFMTRDEQEYYVKKRKSLRLFLLFSRSIIFFFLLLAMSSPFILESRMVKGDPRLTILVDDSYSFTLFDKTIGKEIYDAIKGRIRVDLRTIASGENSALGNGILNNIGEGDNILVISDGNNNQGKLLGDIILFAHSINSTVSTVDMKPQFSDVGVTVDGPYEVIKDTDGNFVVNVNNVGEELSYNLEVSLDNEVIYSKAGKGSMTVPITKLFSQGAFHKLSAKLKNINGDDMFKQNNEFYKTIKVVNRPSVLFVSEKSSPLTAEFERLYDLTTTSNIPSNLDGYMTVVLNDIDANKIIPKIDLLENYVADESNGLVFVGGQNSFDRGGYREAKIIESLLPIKIGAGEESEKSDVHVAVIVDVSGTTTQVYNQYGQVEVRDYDRVIKALGLSVIESLDDKINAGVVVVGTPSSPFVGKVSDIKPIDKKELAGKISRLAGGGQSFIAEGLTQATNMLMKFGGGRNIILISDGRGLFEGPMNEAKNAASAASSRGIKTYVVGVGAVEAQETDFLSDIAAKGNGIYFPADAGKRLKLLFGEPDRAEEDFFNTLAVLDSTHFITYELELDAVISGYNYVIPKSAARLLVTTNKNIPIVAVWRYGLGRIVTISTDDGGKWAGELLQQDNSKLVTRSVNWAVGNLGRKKSFDVSIRDTTLGESTYVEVISKNVPENDKLFFAKTDINMFKAEFSPEETGFFNFLGADVAANYNTEYANLGVNEEFINLINSTGGQVFEKEDIDGILDFVIENSRRVRVETTDFIWPFALITLILLVTEIYIRRLFENRINRW